MKKVIIFNGTPEGKDFNENLVSAVYEPNKDVKFGFLKEGHASIVDEKIYASISSIIEKGYIDTLEGYDGGDIIVQGEAEVWNQSSSTPHDKDAVIIHSIGHGNYYVLLNNENYEVAEKTSSSFKVKLRDDGVSAQKNIHYVVISEL
ncbi:hypothetical protein D3C81_1720850 [compost metagenome]